MPSIARKQTSQVESIRPDSVYIGGGLDPLYPVDHKRRKNKTTAPWAIGLVLALTIAALWGTYIYQVHTDPDYMVSRTGWITTAGVGSLCLGIGVLCRVKIGDVRRYNEQVRVEDEGHVQHQYGMETKHMDQRVPAMNATKDIKIAEINAGAQVRVSENQAYATIEAARHQALVAQQNQLDELRTMFLEHQLRSDDRERERTAGFFEMMARLMAQVTTTAQEQQHVSQESRLDRQHRAIEGDKDRQATLEQMITRFESKITELRFRMEYENPSAAARMEEEIVLMEGFLDQASRINQISDPILRKQMFDRLKNGWA